MSDTLHREILGIIRRMPRTRLEWHEANHGPRVNEYAAAGMCSVIQRVTDDGEAWRDTSAVIVRDGLDDYAFLSKVATLLYMMEYSFKAGKRERSKEIRNLINSQ